MWLRPAQLSDAESIVKLEQECFSDTWSEKTVRDMLTGTYDDVFVIEDGDEVIGYCDIRETLGEAEILRICVTESQRGKNYSCIMMERMKNLCEYKGAKTILLEVRSRNTPAIGLYRKYGFEEIAKRDNYYGDDDALIMRVQL